MIFRKIKELIDDINDSCSIAQIPAKYSYNKSLKSFECKSELIKDEMLLPEIKGLSEEQFYEWTERCNILVMDKWSEIHLKK